MKRFLLAASLAAFSSGCVEDGATPNCPPETFQGLAGAGNKQAAFEQWRAEAEAQGCISAIRPKDGAGGTAAGGASN